MNRRKQMQKAFGVDEFGYFNFPIKISNVRLARLLYGNKSGCSYCFPHGYETVNSTVANRQRNWKKFRKTKWRSVVSKKPRMSGLCFNKSQFNLNSFGDLPIFALNIFVKCEGCSKPRSYAISLIDLSELQSNDFAFSINCRCICSCVVLPV